MLLIFCTPNIFCVTSFIVTYNFGGVALLLDLYGDLVGEEIEPGVDLTHHIGAESVSLIDQLWATLVYYSSQVTNQRTGLSPDSKTQNIWKYHDGMKKLKPSSEHYVVVSVLSAWA